MGRDFRTGLKNRTLEVRMSPMVLQPCGRKGCDQHISAQVGASPIGRKVLRDLRCPPRGMSQLRHLWHSRLDRPQKRKANKNSQTGSLGLGILTNFHYSSVRYKTYSTPLGGANF